MADWSSLCLYVRIGSYTLGSSCVQVYIQSHVRKDQGGFVSKWVSKLTRGKPLPTGTWKRGKWKYDSESKQQRNRSMQQVEGGAIPRGRSVSSFAIPQEKREQKLRQKQGEKNTNAGCLGEGKKKKWSSAQFQQNGLSFGRLACNIISKHLVEGQKKKKEENLRKDSHQKTQASCTSQQTIFNWSLQKTIQSRSFSCLPLSFWTGPYWFWVITINWAGHLERFRPVVDDHLCLGVFFFRFRLKKQQHLQTETDIEPICRWWRLQMKQKKEQTRADCLN